jgi:hypothetical protein
MANMAVTTEVLLSVAIIILTILAIAVFIIYGSGALFYGLFAVTVLIMLFTWYKLSYASGGTAPRAQTSEPAMKTAVRVRSRARAGSRPKRRRR